MFDKISYAEREQLSTMLGGALSDLNRLDRFLVRNKIYDEVMRPSRDAMFWEIHQSFTDVIDTPCHDYGITGDPLHPDGV